MKLKIRIKWYKDVGDYFYQRHMKTEMIVMDATEACKYLEDKMVETGYILIAEHME